MSAFATVLERTGSTRPMTVVLLPKRADDPEIASLEALCRLLVVAPGQPLEDALHPLLPLELPKPMSPAQGAEAALRAELGSLAGDALVQGLLRAARKGKDEVRETLRTAIRSLAEAAP